jgi:hypothetical protein
MLRRVARPISEALARPHIGGPVGFAGAVVLGAGIGRWRLARDGKDVEVGELRACTPGTAEPPAQQTLQTFLAKDAGVTNHGPVQAVAWVDPSPREVLLAGRFAVVTFVDRKLTYRVRRGAVVEFDGSADGWNAVIADEGLTGWRDGLLPQLRCQGLADLALRLHALQRDLRALQLELSIGHDDEVKRLELRE